MIFLCERLSTIVTFVWPLSCMFPQAMLKIVVLKDCFYSVCIFKCNSKYYYWKTFSQQLHCVVYHLCVKTCLLKRSLSCCSARKTGHYGCIDMASPQCVLSCVFQDDIFMRKLFHHSYICVASLLYVSSCDT